MNILLAKIGFVKPVDFRKDLFRYFEILMAYEKAVTNLADKRVSAGVNGISTNWLNTLDKTALDLKKMTSTFSDYIDNLMDKKRIHRKYSDYQIVLPKNKFNSMWEQLCVIEEQ